MEESKKLKLMLSFTIGYFIVFTILSILKRNYEFLYYTIIISALIFFIMLYNKKIHLTTQILFGLTIVWTMHIFGGNIYVSDTRLYDLWIIPQILKYDNIVHAFGSFIATFIVYELIGPAMNKDISKNSFFLFFILVSATMGIGAFNEIIELGAVLFFNAAKQVGDYFNNAFDLVFNLCGSLVASIFIIINKRAKSK